MSWSCVSLTAGAKRLRDRLSACGMSCPGWWVCSSGGGGHSHPAFCLTHFKQSGCRSSHLTCLARHVKQPFLDLVPVLGSAEDIDIFLVLPTRCKRVPELERFKRRPIFILSSSLHMSSLLRWRRCACGVGGVTIQPRSHRADPSWSWWLKCRLDRPIILDRRVNAPIVLSLLRGFCMHREDRA